MEPASKYIDWNVLNKFLDAYSFEMKKIPGTEEQVETINTIKLASDCFAFEEGDTDE